MLLHIITTKLTASLQLIDLPTSYPQCIQALQDITIPVEINTIKAICPMILVSIVAELFAQISSQNKKSNEQKRCIMSSPLPYIGANDSS